MLTESADFLIDLVNQEAQLFEDKDVKRVFIGGFSQGSCVSAAAYHRYSGPSSLGGVICLSGIQAYKFDQNEVKDDQLQLWSNTPIFIYHGSEDQNYPIAKTLQTYQYIQNVIYKEKKPALTLVVEDNLGHTLS